MSFPDTAPFIRYDARPLGTAAGRVDMNAYLAWLDAHGYGIGLTVR
jgi:hypothetical protein